MVLLTNVIVLFTHIYVLFTNHFFDPREFLMAQFWIVTFRCSVLIMCC